MFIDDPENNKRKLNVQVHLFYDDKDAHASYRHFMRKMGPATKETDHYVIIDKKRGNKTVRIFAAKPAKNESGVEANLDRLNTALGSLPVHMMVHRGHSYHVHRTMPHIASRTKLIFLGSCGGYKEIGEVLDKSESAQIISTKGTGRMAINDPLLFDLRKSLLRTNQIRWDQLWSKTGKQFVGEVKDDWQHYVSPHRNYALSYLRAYRKLKNRD